MMVLMPAKSNEGWNAMPMFILRKKRQPNEISLDMELHVVAICSTCLDQDREDNGDRMADFLATLSMEALHSGFKFATFCEAYCPIPALRGDVETIIEALKAEGRRRHESFTPTLH